MTRKLHLSRTSLVVEASVADELVELNVGYLPWVLGESLADQVHTHVERNGTGYYPALDYFRASPGAVDPALITLIDEVVRFCGDYARRELRRRLSRVFASVAVEQVQPTAYSMPRVRPSQPGARERLARHYCPDSFRLGLSVTEVGEPAGDAARRVLEQAHPAFESLRIPDSRPAGA